MIKTKKSTIEILTTMGNVHFSICKLILLVELLLYHLEALFFTVSMKCEFLALITRRETRQTRPAVRHPTCEETRLHRHRSLHRADLSPYLRRRPFISRHRAAANRRLIFHLWCVCITESCETTLGEYALDTFAHSPPRPVQHLICILSLPCCLPRFLYFM